MTANQTINGVPCELLERIFNHLFVKPALKDGDLFHLRALLDAPDVQWLAMEVNGKPWVIKEGPNADKWRAMGYELLPVEPAKSCGVCNSCSNGCRLGAESPPAAQPQGGPAATARMCDCNQGRLSPN